MHLLILPDNDKIKKMYENHSSFHEGDAGLDLFTPEKILVPPRSLVNVKLLNSKIQQMEIKLMSIMFRISYIQDRL